ncbi:MAG: TRAM domain-containing protein [Nanoarchaeota archaeon]
MQYTSRAAPIHVGEEIDVRIEAVGEKGDGIAKKDGFVLFVPNVKTGDQVRIRVTKVLERVGFAEAIGKSQPKEKSAPKPQEKPQVEEDIFDETKDSEDFGNEASEE